MLWKIPLKDDFILLKERLKLISKIRTWFLDVAVDWSVFASSKWTPSFMIEDFDFLAIPTKGFLQKMKWLNLVQIKTHFEKQQKAQFINLNIIQFWLSWTIILVSKILCTTKHDTSSPYHISSSQKISQTNQNILVN